MSKNRVFIMGATIAVLVAVMVAVQVSTASPQALADQAVSVRALSEPSGNTALAAGEASDWFLRHPDMLKPAYNVDLLDYYLQYQTAPRLGGTNGADDYALRHPELRRPANSVDLSDWFLRHASSFTR